MSGTISNQPPITSYAGVAANVVASATPPTTSQTASQTTMVTTTRAATSALSSNLTETQSQAKAQRNAEMLAILKSISKASPTVEKMISLARSIAYDTVMSIGVRTETAQELHKLRGYLTTLFNNDENGFSVACRSVLHGTPIVACSREIAGKRAGISLRPLFFQFFRTIFGEFEENAPHASNETLEKQLDQFPVVKEENKRRWIRAVAPGFSKPIALSFYLSDTKSATVYRSPGVKKELLGWTKDFFKFKELDLIFEKTKFPSDPDLENTGTFFLDPELCDPLITQVEEMRINTSNRAAKIEHLYTLIPERNLAKLVEKYVYSIFFSVEIVSANGPKHYWKFSVDPTLSANSATNASVDSTSTAANGTTAP